MQYSIYLIPFLFLAYSSGWIRCWKGLKRSTQRGRSSFLPSSLPHLLSLRQPRICISAAPFPHSSATEGVGGGHGATTASLESPDLGWQLQMAAAEASGGDRGKGVEEVGGRGEVMFQMY